LRARSALFRVIARRSYAIFCAPAFTASAPRRRDVSVVGQGRRQRERVAVSGRRRVRLKALAEGLPRVGEGGQTDHYSLLYGAAPARRSARACELRHVRVILGALGPPRSGRLLGRGRGRGRRRRGRCSSSSSGLGRRRSRFGVLPRLLVRRLGQTASRRLGGRLGGAAVVELLLLGLPRQYRLGLPLQPVRTREQLGHLGARRRGDALCERRVEALLDLEELGTVLSELLGREGKLGPLGAAGRGGARRVLLGRVRIRVLENVDVEERARVRDLPVLASGEMTELVS